MFQETTIFPSGLGLPSIVMTKIKFLAYRAEDFDKFAKIMQPYEIFRR